MELKLYKMHFRNVTIISNNIGICYAPADVNSYCTPSFDVIKTILWKDLLQLIIISGLTSQGGCSLIAQKQNLTICS